MNTILKTSFAVIAVALLVACGSGAKDKKGDLGDMKAKLEKLKKQKNGLDEQIRQLEEKILKADPAAAAAVQKLVSADTLGLQDFSHYIELQGKVDADQLAYVSPQGLPGVVKEIYVQNGSRVSKGQVLLKLDDVLAKQSVLGAQQNADALRARVQQLQTIYERKQNLWKQNIGSEIDVINAKADVDAFTSQLRAAESQLSSAQENLRNTSVRAGISGVINQVNVKVGEMFSGWQGNVPQLQIVNNNNLKIVANVPENYISSVKKGDSVLALISETGKPYRTVISVVGAAIDPTNRSFNAEAKLPSDPLLKPNQLATMKILDYKAQKAVVVPTNVVQSDEKGKYVYVIEQTAGKMVARKKTVVPGESYNSRTEIKSGLTGKELLITEGYTTVYDGQSVTTGGKSI